MTIGFSTRAVSAPVGVALRNRWGKEPVKYVPLSQFFTSKEPKEGEEDDALYGRRRRPRKKKAKKAPETPEERPQTDTDAETQRTKKAPRGATEAQEGAKSGQPGAHFEGKTRKCHYCQAPATHAVRAQPTGMDVCDGHLKKAKKQLEKMGFKGSEIRSHRMATVYGETTLSTNIATTPVPIGAGDGRKFLDYGPGHPFYGRSFDEPKKKRKRKKKRKGLSQKLSYLLTIP